MKSRLVFPFFFLVILCFCFHFFVSPASFPLSRSSSSHTDNSTPLIFVTISTIPEYLPQAIQQVLLFNPTIDIVIAFGSLAKGQLKRLHEVYKDLNLKGVNLTLFDSDNIESKLVNNSFSSRRLAHGNSSSATPMSSNLSACELCYHMNNVLFEIHGYDLYWTNTIKRYLVLYYYFIGELNYKASDLFHIETDVMIYGNFTKLHLIIKDCHGDVAFPLNIGSLMYFKNQRAVAYMLNSFLTTLRNFNKKAAEKKMNKNEANDMALLRTFKDNNWSTNYSPASESNTPKIHVLELPDNPYAGQGHCVFKRDPTTLYDPHRFGQVLGGLPSNPWVPFVNRDGLFHPNRTDFNWEKDFAGRWIVKYQNFTIFNVHVHSKKLIAFMSNRASGSLPSSPGFQSNVSS